MAEIAINRGSTIVFSVFFDDEAGEPQPLDSATVALFEPTAIVEEHMTVTIDETEVGKVDFHMDWQNDLRNGRSESFRVQFTFPDRTWTSPLITLVVK